MEDSLFSGAFAAMPTAPNLIDKAPDSMMILSGVELVFPLAGAIKAMPTFPSPPFDVDVTAWRIAPLSIITAVWP
jgi:hypothetical protein